MSVCLVICDWIITDVIGPPTEAEGGLFSETNDNSVAVLLTYGSSRVLLAGDPYTGSLIVINVPKLHTLS